MWLCMHRRADVTLEVYGIHACDLFSPSAMSFRNLKLWDTKFKELMPKWTLSPPSPCDGSITVDPEAHGAVHIQHQSTTR